MKTEKWQALITRCQQGDRQAQEELVQAAQERVYFHSQKILKNEEDARDAAQDILICMLENLKTLRDTDAFWSWLNQMSVHICLRRLEKKQREQRFRDLETGRGIAETFENLDDQEIPDKALDNEETRRMVKELVDSLPEAQRLCILMYYYDEMSIQEIASVMETSDGTIKSRLHYARKAIKEGVERYTAQGFKFYGLPILPFLAYFLQKEAEALPAGELISIGEVLAAVGGSAALAAGGMAMSGTGITIAAGTAAALIPKGVAVLAVLTLTGAVTGGLLLHHPKETPPPEPPPAIVEQQIPQGPELPAPPVIDAPLEPEPPAPPVEEAPEVNQAAPVQIAIPAPVPTLPPSEPEPLAPVILPPAPVEIAAPVLVDLIPWEPEAPPEEPEEPEQPTRPEEREPSDSDDRDSNSSYTPPVEVLPPEQEISYYPNPDFGEFLGMQDGVYVFSIEIEGNLREVPFPLSTTSAGYDAYSVRIETSDDRVIGFRNDRIYGMNTGTAEVRYFIRPFGNSTKEVEVLVHATVVSRKPADPDSGILLNPSCGIYLGESSGVHIFEAELLLEEARPSPLQPGDYFVRVGCLEEGIAAYGPDGFQAIAPGKASLQWYTAESEEGPYELYAIVHVTVLEEGPPEPSEIVKAELSEGYGKSSVMLSTFPELGVGNYVYRSSNLEVVSVGARGQYSLLKPGTAVLTGTNVETQKQYALTVHVEDRFYQEFLMEDCTIKAGETFRNRVKEYLLGTYNDILLVQWSSSDPSVVTVEGVEHPIYAIDCNITGVSAGTAEVSAVLSMRINTCVGPQLMETRTSFQVTVEAQPELRRPLTAHRGYTRLFATEWPGISGPLTYTSSNPDVAYIDERGWFSILEAGEALLTATDSQGARWILEVRALESLDWSYSISDLRLFTGNTSLNLLERVQYSSNMTRKDGQWTSSAPEIVEVVSGSLIGCSVKAVSPGNAVITGITTFQVETAAGTRMMEDKVSFKVTVESWDPPVQEEQVQNKTLEQFGYRSGCGYISDFATEWGESLPSPLTFQSSDPEKVDIGGDGTFQTLAPGTVTLTATETYNPKNTYNLTITVAPGLDWLRHINDICWPPDGVAYVYWWEFDHFKDPAVLLSSSWVSSDPEIVTVADGDVPVRQFLTALKPGEAEITGTLQFQTTNIFTREPMYFEETVSYTVRVE